LRVKRFDLASREAGDCTLKTEQREEKVK